MNTPMPLYTARATSVGGRVGTVSSDDGILNLNLNLTVPTAIGGDGAAGTNPEQLFAAGYSACFAGALGVVARMQNIALGPFSIAANITFIKAPDGYGLAAKLTGHFSELKREQAEALMQATHQVCPYSRMTRGNMPVELLVR